MLRLRSVLLGVVLLGVGSLAGCGSAESGEQAAQTTSVSLSVEGMMCAESCAKTVEEILAEQPGVHEAIVDYERKQATCRVNPQDFEPAAAIAELADQDFTATVQP